MHRAIYIGAPAHRRIEVKHGYESDTEDGAR